HKSRAGHAYIAAHASRIRVGQPGKKFARCPPERNDTLKESWHAVRRRHPALLARTTVNKYDWSASSIDGTSNEPINAASYEVSKSLSRFLCRSWRAR